MNGKVKEFSKSKFRTSTDRWKGSEMDAGGPCERVSSSQDAYATNHVLFNSYRYRHVDQSAVSSGGGESSREGQRELFFLLGGVERSRMFCSSKSTYSPKMNDQEAFTIAVEEAKAGYSEGGVPVSFPASLLYPACNFTSNLDRNWSLDHESHLESLWSRLCFQQ